MTDLTTLPASYPALLEELKSPIRAAQVQAAFAVNRELILLYWSIGRDLSQRFAAEEWGGKIIDRLARDLQTEFPGVEGFSPRNPPLHAFSGRGDPNQQAAVSAAAYTSLLSALEAIPGVQAVTTDTSVPFSDFSLQMSTSVGLPGRAESTSDTTDYLADQRQLSESHGLQDRGRPGPAGKRRSWRCTRLLSERRFYATVWQHVDDQNAIKVYQQ